MCSPKVDKLPFIQSSSAMKMGWDATATAVVDLAPSRTSRCVTLVVLFISGETWNFMNFWNSHSHCLLFTLSSASQRNTPYAAIIVIQLSRRWQKGIVNLAAEPVIFCCFWQVSWITTTPTYQQSTSSKQLVASNKSEVILILFFCHRKQYMLFTRSNNYWILFNYINYILYYYRILCDIM